VVGQPSQAPISVFIERRLWPQVSAWLA